MMYQRISTQWWKTVCVMICIFVLSSAFGIVYYGPSARHKQDQKPYYSEGSVQLLNRASENLVDDELWTKPAAVDADWTLEVEWDRRPSSIVQGLLKDEGNSTSHKRFLSFFRNPEVGDFIKQYGIHCNPKQHLYTFLFSTLWSIPVGFGSNINTALANFVLAIEPEVRATHRFQFVHDNWLYASLPNFFKDLGRTVNCSFFLDSTRYVALALNQTAYQNVHINFSKAHGLHIEEGKDVIMHHNSGPFWRMLSVFSQLACRDGPDLIFRKRSVIAKAVWQPLKGLEDLLYLLWRRLVEPAGQYIGIHIRRGDKIGTEMEEIPVALFMEKLREICPSPCPHKVFVMTDDGLSFNAIRDLTNGSYAVFRLQSLLEEVGFPADGYVVSTPDATVRRIPETNRTFWTTQTKQLVMEITVLALADQIICTMSSNICQLAALLKGSYEGNVHSLDIPWESVLV